MIYKVVDANEPIRQGDIFRSIPHVIYDPENLFEITEGNGSRIKKKPSNWIDKIGNHDIRVAVRVQSCIGIVINQDCDTQRQDYIALFEINDFFTVTNISMGKDPIKWIAENLPKKAREAQGAKWFYLPPDLTFGFEDKMAVDFRSVVTVPSLFLDHNKTKLRIGRLNHEADEHFREHMSNYFRRYAYDEWYPFSKAEFNAYQSIKGNENSEPRDYQK
jgi:hypothetical protein